MTSQKQLIANKLNAEKAGVKTEKGKNIVRYNSFKHGLTSKSLLSDIEGIEETQEVFQEIYDGLADSIIPRNCLEASLVEKMAIAQLKLRRLDVWEAGLFRRELDFSIQEYKFEVHDVSQFELALKYKQSLEAQFYRALGSLMQSRQPTQLDLFLPSGGSKNE